MLTEPRRTMLIFCLVHAFLFLCIFSVPALTVYFDPGGLERYLAVKILDGQVPYRDFASEYPPLALLAFLLPALVTRSQLPYNIVFVFEMLLFDLLIMWAIAKIVPRFGLPLKETLLIYTLLLLAIGPLVIIRFDFLPASLVMVSLLAFGNGKNRTAWATVALGVGAKLYPVLIVPLFAIYHLAKKQYRRLVEGCVAFLAVLVVLVGPWLVIDAAGFWDSMVFYHLGRGLHSESAYGTFLLLGKVMGLTQVDTGLSFGSWNLFSPLADRLAGVSFYITAGLLLVAYGWFAGLLRKRSNRGEQESLVESRLLQFAWLVILVFILTNKVFSAQYLIWLCPLLPMIARRGRDILWLLFIVAAALTQYVFPYAYFAFEQGEPYAVIMLAVRNLALIVAAIITVVFICREGKAMAWEVKDDYRYIVP